MIFHVSLISLLFILNKTCYTDAESKKAVEINQEQIIEKPLATDNCMYF